MPWISCNLQSRRRVPVEIEARSLHARAHAYIYICVCVCGRRNRDKYKQKGAWKQIPLRMRNEFCGDWKYLVCSRCMGKRTATTDAQTSHSVRAREGRLAFIHSSLFHRRNVATLIPGKAPADRAIDDNERFPWQRSTPVDRVVCGASLK